MSETVTVREVLALLLAADDYPRQNNADWDGARELETSALAKGEGAIGSPDDPPEFRVWLDALRRPGIQNDEREAIYDAMYDHFDASTTKVLSAKSP
jgi:hypothetical protein